MKKKHIMKISQKKIIFYIILFFIVQAIFIFLKKNLNDIQILNKDITYSNKGLIVYFGLLFVDFINTLIAKRRKNTSEN